MTISIINDNDDNADSNNIKNKLAAEVWLKLRSATAEVKAAAALLSDIGKIKKQQQEEEKEEAPYHDNDIFWFLAFEIAESVMEKFEVRGVLEKQKNPTEEESSEEGEGKEDQE